MKHDLIAKSPQTKGVKRRRRWAGDLLGIVFLCVLLLASAAVVRKAIRPVCLNYCEGHAVKRLRHEYKSEKRKNERLKGEIDFYRSHSGATAGARELGYVRPGEIPVSIEEPKQAGQGR